MRTASLLLLVLATGAAAAAAAAWLDGDGSEQDAAAAAAPGPGAGTAAALPAGAPPGADAGALSGAPSGAPAGADAGALRHVAARDYFLVGDALDRTYLDPEDPDDPRTIHVRRLDEAAAPRWSFRIPRKHGGLELIFGFEHAAGAPAGDEPGDLYLYAFEVQSKSVDTERVVLSQPALIGTARNLLGGPAHVTPVSARTTLQVDVLGKPAAVQASLSGEIRAAWEPAAPRQVGATHHEDVVGLRLGLDLSVTGTLLGLELTREADSAFDGVLARGVGYVEFGSDDDERYRLVPPPEDSGRSSSASGATK